MEPEPRKGPLCDLCSFEEYDLAKNLIQQSVVGGTYLTSLTVAMELFRSNQWQPCRAQCDMLLDITWEKLNTGYWKDVSISWRHAYSLLSVTKAFCEYHLLPSDSDIDFAVVLKTCDMGLLMGAPIVNNLLSRMAERFRIEFEQQKNSSQDDTTDKQILSPNKRSNTEEKNGTDKSEKRLRVGMPTPETDPEFPHITPLTAVQRAVLPSIEAFRVEYMAKAAPVVIEGGMSHWPAMTERRWDLPYLKRIAGCRTVPVELGRKYTDEDWSQKLMLMSQFIDKYVANEGSNPGYLAQHQLFEQIPELERDISIPSYCSLSELAEDVDINAWFGPKGTISPLHHDPKHNFLCQVVGYKYIKLYSPDDSRFVYPHESEMLFNTSQVDVENPDLDTFPDFVHASCKECVLGPGEMLYIPPKYWHYVRSLSVSFSVSFWW